MASPSRPEIIDLPAITFPKQNSTRKEVDDALKKYGCFMAKYETLEERRSKLFKASEEIFDRLATTNSGKPYFEFSETPAVQVIENFIPNMQPEGRQAILSYTTTATDLERMVREIVFETEKLPKPRFRFQMMKEEFSLDFLDHEDREEFLAVLDLNQAKGLEMRTTDGKCSRIEVRPSTFLIMAGKPHKDWSKGKILHGNEEKYAVGLFSYRKRTTEVPKEQVERSSLP